MRLLIPSLFGFAWLSIGAFQVLPAQAHAPISPAELEAILADPGPPPSALSEGIPSSIETLYVVEMSHLDIGFTDPPSVVAEVHWQVLEDVLDYCDQDADFRWTIEELWQLEQFWLRTTGANQLRMEQRLQEGRIELAGGFASMHSANMAPWETVRWMGLAAPFLARLGIRPRVVLGDDVPGWSWGLPAVMAATGVDFFLAGENSFIGTGATIPRADYPFYWSGPAGDRVLTWISDGAYVEGFTDYGLTTLGQAFNKLSLRLPEWEASGYPFNAILVMRGFDNAGASLGLTSLARDWNNLYDNPKIIPASASQFFDHILAQAPELAQYRGDWSGRWDVGALSTPRTEIRIRQTQAIAPAAEALSIAGEWLAGTQGSARDRRRWFDLVHALVQFNEHSGGGTPWPGYMTEQEALQQNREVADGARLAHNLAKQELSQASTALAEAVAGGDSLQLVVLNSREWARGGVVMAELPPAYPVHRVRAIDESSGTELPTQILPLPGFLAIEVPEVPSVGYRRIAIERTAESIVAARPEQAKVSRADSAIGRESTLLSNGIVELTIAHTDGSITSLIDLRTSREWIDHELEQPFNGMIRASNMQHLGGISHPTQEGRVFVEASAAGPLVFAARLRRPSTAHRHVEVILRKDSPVVELVNEILRDELPWINRERGFDYFAFRFPFDLPGFETRIATSAGPMRLWGDQPDQLPGAEMARFSVGTWVDLSTDAAGMTCLVPDALVAEFETIRFGRNEPPARATFVSRFDKKADEAEFLGGQIGPIDVEPGEPSLMVLRYGFVPRDGPWDALETERLGAGFADPLRVALVPAGGGNAPPLGSALNLSGLAVRLLDLKPAEDGRGVILRIQETNDSPGELRVETPTGIWTRAWRVNPFEEDGAELETGDGVVVVPVGARETVALRLL